MRAEKYNHHWIQMYFNSDDERQKFKQAVSYKVPGHEFNAAFQSGKWNGTKCFLTDKDKISYGLFKSLFMEHKLVYEKEFPELSFDDIPIYKKHKYERRQYQLNAINSIFKHKRGIISSIMGSGKSLISAATISKHLEFNPKNKVLFIVYDRNILNQSIKNFTKYGFNATKFGDGEKNLTGDIIVATIQSLSRLQNPNKTLASITMTFTDESHNSKASTSKAILTKLVNCKYYIGLTATPYKKNTLELAELESVLGPVIFEYGFDEAVKNNSVARVKAFFVKTPLDEALREKLYERKNYKVIWDEGIKTYDARNLSVAIMLNSLIEVLDTSNLIFVDRIEHGQKIAEQLKKYPKIRFSQMYGSDDTFIRDMKKENLAKQNLNTLLSSVIKEGVDFQEPSPVIAINASGRKGFVSLIQFLGRITRSNEQFKNFRAYIDFVDYTNNKLLEHSKERIKACEEFGIETIVCENIQDALVEIVKYYKLMTID